MELNNLRRSINIIRLNSFYIFKIKINPGREGERHDNKYEYRCIMVG